MEKERIQFNYGDEDIRELLTINSILLELVCTFVIRNSFAPDEDKRKILNALIFRTKNVEGEKDSRGYNQLALKIAQDIDRLVDDKGNHWVKITTTQDFDPPVEP